MACFCCGSAKELMVKMIRSRTHGFLDYTVSLFIIMMPWVFHFAKGGMETLIPVVLGITSILYSIFTDYEWGLLRLLNLKIHLVLDLISGILLASSPWIFGFSNDIYLPHMVIGLLEIGVVMLSDNICCNRATKGVSMRRFSGKDSPEVL